jgi:sugar lactone lactonase YvrE
MADLRSTVLADGFHFLEGPRWRDGRLWMSDVGAGSVVTIGADGQRRTVIEIPGMPSGLGFLPDGSLIVVSIHERKLYRLRNGELAIHADLAGVAPSTINDMVVDSNGRAYVGSIGYDFFAREEPKPGSIILVDVDGRAKVVAEGLTFPNGSVITSDRRLVVAESFGRRLSSYDIKPDGTLQNHRVEAELGGTPDGICLDNEGGIWVAMLEQGFARVKHGKIVDHLATAGHMGIACQLGGADGRTLFCLSFRGELEDIGVKPGARVETVRVEAAGAGSP